MLDDDDDDDEVEDDEEEEEEEEEDEAGPRPYRDKSMTVVCAFVRSFVGVGVSVDESKMTLRRSIDVL